MENIKPNIILIMTDQQQAAMRKSEGFALDTMPFLDSLGKNGVDFGKAYTTMPVCGPARVSLLTGRYPSVSHVKTNHNIQDAYYDKDLFDILKENNYQTALCGKNHSHKKKEDFDYFYELGHHGGKQEDRSLEEIEFDKYIASVNRALEGAQKPTPFPLECQLPYRCVTKAMDWINSNKDDEPFFLWLSFPEPHNPYQVPEPYFSMFAPDSLPPNHAKKKDLEVKSYKYRWMYKMWDRLIKDNDKKIPQMRSDYCGMLKLIDDQLSRFDSFLNEKGLKENTLIIYISDHGDFVGEYGLIRKGPELSEVLSRIPMIFVGPEIDMVGKRTDIHCSIVDILPTICDIISADIPKGVQGKSLYPILKGKDFDKEKFISSYIEHGFGGKYYSETDTLTIEEEGALYPSGSFDSLNSWTQAGTMRAIVKGNWKLVYDMEGNGELYDIVIDPGEKKNLFGLDKYREIQMEMIEEMLLWTIKTQDPLPYPRNRYIFKE